MMGQFSAAGSGIREPYIIAETAYNHEGDIGYLHRMVAEIADLGLDAVKFHLLLDAESYMARSHPLFAKTAEWTFSPEQWNVIIDYSVQQGLEVVALCDDVASIAHILKWGKAVNAIELHSTGLNDRFLLEAACRFEGQIILGTGGSTVDEIEYAVDFLRAGGRTSILLMHGFQAYPTDYRQVNLLKALKLGELFGLPVGYADHTAFDDPYNELISVMGAAMGINVLEKHYTLDYGGERVDYQAAVGREMMGRVKELMRLALVVHGSGDIGMSEPELKYGSTGPMKKAIVARKAIRKGERLSRENLTFKRTRDESPVEQRRFAQLVGCEAARDMEQDEVVDFSKVRSAAGPS